MYHNNSRDLFSEVRKMNAGKRSQPVSVDGKGEHNDICHIFSDKFDKLYIVYHMMLIYFRRLSIKLIKRY